MRVESPRHELVLLPSASSIIYSDRSATTTLATLLVFNTKLDEAVGGAIAWLIAPSVSSSRALGVESPRHELVLLPSASSIIYSNRSATTTLATLLVFNTKLDEAVGGAIVWLIVIVGFFNSALYDHGSNHGSTAAYQ